MTTEKKIETFPRTGVAYVAVIEHELLSSNALTVCSMCLSLGMDKPLKRCNGCMLVDYCSKECQRRNWKVHKGFCWMVQGKGKRSGWLDGVGKGEEGHDGVKRRVIDAYRLRSEVDWRERGEGHGLYAGQGERKEGLVWADGDVVEDFQKWLDLCEEAGVLPEWWRFEDRMETLGLAMDRESGESVYQAIDEQNLMVRYGGKPEIRNALLIMCELVVGYEGKGREKNDEWYMDFSEFMDLHPQERMRLVKGTLEAVEKAKETLENEGGS